MKDIVPYLLSPVRLNHLAANLTDLLQLLLLGDHKKLRLEDLEGTRPVHMLRPLLGAFHLDPRWEVLHPDRGLDLVDVLPAGPAGAHRRHLEVRVGDVDALHELPEDRHHLNSCEARLPGCGLVEGRLPDEAVRPVLAGEEAVGEAAVDLDGDGLDARLLPGAALDNPRGVPRALAVSEIHALEHLRPILCVGPARARRDREDGARLVVRPGEQRLEPPVLEHPAERPELRPSLFQKLGSLLA
mmetsp:Transcript_37988/g.90238  ORF Transcript_37988/g.90238 Transcript_37988/m.90238 type:complete len:243 (-) Transcript_37988:574-1302(-)